LQQSPQVNAFLSETDSVTKLPIPRKFTNSFNNTNSLFTFSFPYS
jgi:hypothetical protein